MSDKEVKEEPIKIGPLKVVKINDINLVPRYLLDQVKGRQWQTDQLIPYLDKATNLNLYVLVDGKSIIKGVLLFQPNYIENNIEVIILSVDRQYQFNGIIPNTLEFLRKAKEHYKLKTIKIRTNRPNAFEKHGFRILDFIMEVK